MKALVTITQGNGTFNAAARVGTDKLQRASCTMSRELAAKRAAGKALGCDEDRVKLTEWTRVSGGHFRLGDNNANVGASTDSVFSAEWHPETFMEPLTWHTTGNPDADTTVLIQDTDNEITIGFWDGEFWRDRDTEAVIGEVKAWADMPGGVP